MKKISTGIIKLKDIKHTENSRMRGKEDVSDLMHDIEQRGLLQNIGIRKSDNAIIFGNRRAKAFEKLGYEEIEADFFDDVNDNDLLIMNLAENIKRKSLGSIEIGRVCKILNSGGMTQTEIGEKLGIPHSRVRSAIGAFNITVGTPFEKLVRHGNYGGHKGIPESLIWKIQHSISRARKLSKEDWNILLSEIEKGRLTTEHVAQLRKILLSDNTIPMNKAIDILEKCDVIHIYIHVEKSRLNKLMKRDRFDKRQEFIKHIIRSYDKDLMF